MIKLATSNFATLFVRVLTTKISKNKQPAKITRFMYIRFVIFVLKYRIA